MSAPVFISFSWKDRTVAETICAALENRGFTCWIGNRDVEPGENFQIAIVRAIRAAKVMVLVFSANANNSEDVKKELVLATQSRLVVIPVRVEDVTPDEALAYEFATRQWIDLFKDWENSIQRLVRQLARVAGVTPEAEALAAVIREKEATPSTATDPLCDGPTKDAEPLATEGPGEGKDDEKDRHHPIHQPRPNQEGDLPRQRDKTPNRERDEKSWWLRRVPRGHPIGLALAGAFLGAVLIATWTFSGVLRPSVTHAVSTQPATPPLAAVPAPPAPSAQPTATLAVQARTLIGHSDAVRSVAFSPDGRTVASSSSDGTLRLWDVASGQALRTLTGDSFGLIVWSVAFSPDGRTLASTSSDGTLKFWDAANGQVLRRLSAGPVRAWWRAAFSSDGRTVASGDPYNHTIKLWDVASGQLRRTLELHSSSNVSPTFAFSPDGNTLVSSTFEGALMLWNVASGGVLRTAETTGVGSVDSIAISPDGRTLALGGGAWYIIFWNVASGQFLRKTENTGMVLSVAFSPDGRTLASGSYGQLGTLKLWDVANGQLLQSLIGHSDHVESVAFSPDGRILASGSDDRTIRLWDVANVTEASR